MADIYAEVSAVGIQGLSGTGTGNGATGSTGPQGNAGATGPQGPAGASGVGGGGGGANGASGATGAQGASGSTGSTGLTGATGLQGASGVAGSSGVQGASGLQGIDGASGYVGSDGASGVAGATGTAGATGSQGQTGATGLQGASGVDGTSFTIVGTVADSSLLPNPYSGGVGDGYITEDLGDLWVWDGSTWLDAGPIVGPAGATGISGATGVRGATGIRGASGVDGATGPQGIQGASGTQGIDGASGYVGSDGATGPQGIQGASGISGASGYIGLDGATGLTGATGAGLVTTTFTTSSTDQVIVETIDGSVYRSAKYDMQLTSSMMYQATELRLLIDLPNVYLTQYGAIGDPLGEFEAYYSPLSNDYSSPDINTVSLSFWNGSNVRIYTTDNDVILALLSAPIGTVFTLNSGAATFTSSALFTEVSAGIYGTTATTTRSPTLLISRIVWAGTGDIELRFTPVNAVSTLKYNRVLIEL